MDYVEYLFSGTENGFFSRTQGILRGILLRLSGILTHCLSSSTWDISSRNFQDWKDLILRPIKWLLKIVSQQFWKCYLGRSVCLMVIICAHVRIVSVDYAVLMGWGVLLAIASVLYINFYYITSFHVATPTFFRLNIAQWIDEFIQVTSIETSGQEASRIVVYR